MRDVFALGDLAAVPDLTRPGHYTAPTAQHALRQGRTVARSVAASLGRGSARAYRHHDLGLAADLGGWDGIAKPLGIPLTGLAARTPSQLFHGSDQVTLGLLTAGGWWLIAGGILLRARYTREHATLPEGRALTPRS